MVEREGFCLGKQTPPEQPWAEWRDGLGLPQSQRYRGHRCRTTLVEEDGPIIESISTAIRGYS